MILLRHAESAWNSHFGPTRVDPGIPDPWITPLGETQALSAREKIKGMKIERIVSSPYQRTLQTASIVAGHLDILIEVDCRVGERRVFSCDVGNSKSSLERLWPSIDFGHLDEIWWNPKIESMEQFNRRCRSFMDEAVTHKFAKTTLVVTHWGFIRAATGSAVGNTEFVQPSSNTEMT